MFLNFSGVDTFRINMYKALIRKIVKRVTGGINKINVTTPQLPYLITTVIKLGKVIGNTNLETWMII